MKTIIKITFVCIAALVFNTVTAQNALEKRTIKKAEVTSTTAVKAQPVINDASQRQEQTNTAIQPQPAAVKQDAAKQVKTPAQMAGKPLQKKTVGQPKEAVEQKSVK